MEAVLGLLLASAATGLAAKETTEVITSITAIAIAKIRTVFIFYSLSNFLGLSRCCKLIADQPLHHVTGNILIGGFVTTNSQWFPLVFIFKPVLHAAPIMKMVKPIGFDKHLIAIQQAGQACLARFRTFILAGFSGFWIV